MRNPLIALTIALCVPSTAGAQEQARPDPDSPAGVEYQLPLDQARDDAGGGGGGGNGAGGGGGGASQKEAPLFGSGIRKEGAVSGSNSPKRASRATPSPEVGTRTPRASIDMTSESASDSPSVSLIAAGILLAGGLLGLGLRRGLRPARRS